MAINYVVAERKNGIDRHAPAKHYALAKSSGVFSLRELAMRISSMSTVSPIDTVAMLEALLQVIPDLLAEGKIVQLGDLGSFYTTINSEGTELADDFNDALIKKTNIKFRPGNEVKNALNNVKYKKLKIN